MYVLLTIGIFQPAMLVYQRVSSNFRLKVEHHPDMILWEPKGTPPLCHPPQEIRPY